MIRKATIADADAIARIYNKYVEDSVISFETEAVSDEEMRRRVCEISSSYPFLVYEQDGCVVGYCYAHQWKERAAYSRTLETTIYLDNAFCHQGIGRKLMEALIDRCREAGVGVLIACITGGNDRSIALHERLGFKKVSHFYNVGCKLGSILDVVDYELEL